MREQDEVKLKTKLAKFFRTNFTFLGMTDEMKEARVYKLVDDMFTIISSSNGTDPEKLPTHIS